MNETKENQLEKSSDNQKKLTRRGFIKWTTALAVAGAAVVGIGVGYGSDLLLRPTTEKTTTATTTKTGTATVTAPVPTLSYKPPLSPAIQAKVDAITKNLVDVHAGDTVSYTVCSPGDRAGCFFKVYTKNGIIKSIVADDTINPDVAREDNLGLDTVLKGRLQSRPCALAFGLPYMVYDPRRILYPMRLIGPKGSGQYIRISWTEALDTIYQKMSEAKEKFGPYSILVMGFGNTRLSSLIRCGVQTWGDQSGSGWYTGSVLSMGQSYGMAGSQSEIFHSKLVVLFGYEPTILEGNGNTESLYLHVAKEQGVKFISIDPRYTIDSQALGSQWIPIKPGTDLALLLAMADVMFQQNSYNQAFVNQWVEPTGFAKWKAYVTGASDGVEKSPEWGEPICGVPAATTRALVTLILQNNPTKFHLGYEMCRAQSIHITTAALLVQAMTGYFLSKGGGCVFGMIGSNPWGHIPDISAVDNFKPAWDVPTAFNLLKWQKAILLRPQFDNGTLTQAQFNGAIGMKADAPPVNIKVMTFPYFMKQHTIDIFGAAERIQAIKKVFAWGQFSIIDSNALYMDILLPAIERFMEEPGERCIAFWGAVNRFYAPFCGYTWKAYAAPVIQPLGEARPEEWVYIMLAKRFGVDAQYNPDVTPALAKDEWDWAKWNAAAEPLQKAGYQAWATNATVRPLNPPSWDDFKKKPIFRDDGVDEGPFALYVNANKTPFLTPSGKLEAYHPLLADPKTAATAYFDDASCLGTIGPGATPLPKWVDNLEYTVFDPKAKTYPLHLITPNSQHRNHSYGLTNPLNHGDCYRHGVWISPTDANARGIKDGDLVRVFSDVGEMYIEAYVTGCIMPGIVAIYHGGHYVPSGTTSQTMPDGIDTGGAPNLLIPDLQPGTMVIGPCIGQAPVQVEKVISPTMAGTT